MKKIAILALSLISMFGISSCNKVEKTLPDTETNELRRVNFTAYMEENVEMSTRTGVTLKMIHTWQKTKEENIHLYEQDNIGGTVLLGEDVTITTEDPYEVATFTAGFYNSIVVNPTRAAKSYTYKAVIAQQNAENNRFFIPEVQYPDADTWIDPDADFLVGLSAAYSTYQNDTPIDFAFGRPVAVSRFAITNLEGNYLESLTITADEGNILVGSAAYDDIDFEDVTVSFSQGSNQLKLIFPEGTKVSSTTYANFVSALGTVRIKEVEVVTDQWIYTKKSEEGKGNMTFKVKTFKNIAMDMTLDELCTRVHNSQQPLKFMKADQEITSDTYDLASEDDYVSPSLEGAAEGATVSYDSSNPEVATVEDVEGVLVVTPVAVGETIITATASAVEGEGEDPGYSETSITYTLTVSDSTVPPVEQTLVFTPDSLGYVIGQTFQSPVLSGAYTTVTYASNNETVATVDAETGEVTFNGVEGKVKITATAAAGTVEGTKYLEGSATYVVTVTEPSAKIVYYKASKVDVGYSYMIVSNGKAAKYNDGNVDAATVTFNGDNIELDEADASLLWAVAKNTDEDNDEYGEYTFKNSDKYLYRSGESNPYTLGTANEVGNKAVWFVEQDKFYIVGQSGTYTAFYNDGWQLDKNNTGVTNLYTTRQPQTLSFTGETAEYDLGTTSYVTNLPTLSGAQTTVSYSSSKTSVATVDPNTGAVTPLAKGTTVITATAAGNDSYQSATATYTLTVINSAATTTTYYKHTKAVVGKSYIIVSGGYALKNNNGSIAAEAVTVTSDKIELEDASAILWTATTPTTTDTDYPGFNYSNNGYYLFRSSSTLSLESTVTDEHNNFNYAISSSKYYLKCGSYYVYYSSGWTAGYSSSSAKEVALYCAEQPTTETYTYTKVATATTSLADGTYLIVNPDEAKALDGSSTGTSNSVSVSPSSNKITGDFSANEFEIKATDDGYTIKSASGYLYYKSSSSSSSSSKIAYQSSKAYFTINTTEKGTDRFCFQSKASTSYYLYYYSSSSSSSSYFKFGGSGAPDEDKCGVLLFKKETK